MFFDVIVVELRDIQTADRLLLPEFRGVVL